MKLLLINPVNHLITSKIDKRYRFPPLNLSYVAALTPTDWEVALIDENVDRFEYQECDLVALTAITSTAPRAYEIASMYRKRGIHTVIGGIHASMLPDEALNYVDTVVIGDAESTWPRLISDFTSHRMQRVYRGEWLELSNLVQPRRDLFSKKYVFGVIQTSRGCPMDCEFCSVSAFNGRNYRQRPVDEVLDELETIPQKLIFFVDDNLIGYGNENRAIELFEGMIKRKIRKQWFCQASLNFADNEEVLKLASRAGCRMAFIGIEAEDVDALEEVGKKINLRREYDECFKHINRHKIAVLGSFISGMDADNEEKLLKRADYIINSRGINVIQWSLFTPLPGTRLFAKLVREKRLLYTNFPSDWERYGWAQVVYKPAQMTADELLAVEEKGVSRVYSYRSILRKFFTTFYETRSIITALWSFFFNMAYRKMIIRWRASLRAGSS